MAPHIHMQIKFLISAYFFGLVLQERGGHVSRDSMCSVWREAQASCLPAANLPNVTPGGILAMYSTVVAEYVPILWPPWEEAPCVLTIDRPAKDLPVPRVELTRRLVCRLLP